MLDWVNVVCKYTQTNSETHLKGNTKMDYSVIYTAKAKDPVIIDHIQAETDRKALNLARRMYKGDSEITVKRVA